MYVVAAMFLTIKKKKSKYILTEYVSVREEKVLFLILLLNINSKLNTFFRIYFTSY